MAVFAYSYSCRDTLREAKRLGHATVLGQFDPGPLESDIVDEERRAFPEFLVAVPRYSDDYFGRWREETELADRIVVNSEWSAECLRRSGVPSERLRLLPLIYEPSGAATPRRDYPPAFTASRPLRVLFLGQIILRKGVARLLDAAELLRSEPVEFRLVGPTDITNLRELLADRRNVRWYGPVPRAAVADHYSEADVYILPTLSDGFALTQLEALARKLPVIATRRCGEVVIDGLNGIVLPEANAECIEAALRRLLDRPETLAELSERCDTSRFRLCRLAANLTALGFELGTSM